MARSGAQIFSGREAPTAFQDGVVSWGRTLLRHAGRILCLWADRRRQRQLLAEMEEHRLEDIGRTRAEAQSEARKPFWAA